MNSEIDKTNFENKNIDLQDDALLSESTDNKVSSKVYFLSSYKGKRLLNFLYSWGAAIIILGALFKLTHIKYGDTMLFIGMISEFLIFLVSGFERPQIDYQWEKVYPELSAGNISKELSRTNVAPNEKMISCEIDPKFYTYIESIQQSLNELTKLCIENKKNEVERKEMSFSLDEDIKLSIQNYTMEIDSELKNYLQHLKDSNQKVTTLSEAYANQFDDIQKQTESLKYLNKGLYDLARNYEASLSNAHSFRIENERLVQQLIQLNTVYARLIDAMTHNMGIHSSGGYYNAYTTRRDFRYEDPQNTSFSNREKEVDLSKK